jgi:hypothetical protein
VLGGGEVVDDDADTRHRRQWSGQRRTTDQGEACGLGGAADRVWMESADGLCGGAAVQSGDGESDRE